MMSPRAIDGIICFSTDPWGEMKRPGQLMRCLSKRVPVLYVEPYLSVTSLVKNYRTAFAGPTRERVRRAMRHRLDELEPGLHVMTTMVTIPPQRLSFVPEATLGRVARGQHHSAVRRALRAAKQMGMSAPALWITYPVALPAPGGDEVAVQVYDCMDRWTDFPDTLTDTKWQALVSAFEHELLESSDMVFCSAEGLFESKRDVARGSVTLVRNGAQIEHFAPAGRPVPADLAKLPRPIVGYVGALADWVDFDLLRGVATRRPDWSVVLIGPVFQGKTTGDARALGRIADLPNVHLLGPRPYDEVPAYVEAFDVAMIPFKLNGLTEDTNPIKVYEYLAAGVPVVSTPLREVATMPHVRIASTAEEFVGHVESGVQERHDSELVGSRMALAAENSWEARAQAAWAVVLGE